MELTFVTDLGQTFVVEIDPNMELENVMALLEAEVRSSIRVWVAQTSLICSTPQSSIPVNEQSISYEGRELQDPKATIRQLGVRGENAMLLLRRKIANIGGRCALPQSTRARCTDRGRCVACADRSNRTRR